MIKFFTGDLPPVFATSPQLGRGKLLAIVIIANSVGMFNEKRTFFKNFTAEKKVYQVIGQTGSGYQGNRRTGIGYQINRKSGCRITENQDIRINNREKAGNAQKTKKKKKKLEN